MPLDGAAAPPCPECTESSRVFIVFVYSVCATLLLVTIYRVFRSRCMLSRTFPFFSMRYTRRQVNGSQNYQTQLTTAGLDSAAIISLPAVQFTKRAAAAAAAGDDEQQNCECAICLGGFTEGEWLRLLPSCLHAFHVSCVDVWLRDNSNCPLCRANVLDDQLPAPALEPLPREEPRQERVRSLRVVQLRFLSYER